MLNYKLLLIINERKKFATSEEAVNDFNEELIAARNINAETLQNEDLALDRFRSYSLKDNILYTLRKEKSESIEVALPSWLTLVTLNLSEYSTVADIISAINNDPSGTTLQIPADIEEKIIELYKA
jgi:hypothetical protein